MSRSYKKAPVYTDREHGAKWWKRQANRKVRHYNDILNNKSYRKVYNPWYIHDYISYWLKAEAIAWYEKHKDKSWWFKDANTLEEYLNRYWEHDFHRK